MKNPNHHRDSETQRLRGHETRRQGETHDIHDIDDKTRPASTIRSFREAVDISLKDGVGERVLFVFSRALRALEITTGKALPTNDLDGAFSLWWSVAKPDGEDFDEWRLDFISTFAKTKSALGSNSVEVARQRAAAEPLPQVALRYRSARLQRLVAVCWHLQQIQGNNPFFLSVRDAAGILGAEDPREASKLLAGLVQDRLLIEVEKGTRHRATRFKLVVSADIKGDS